MPRRIPVEKAVGMRFSHDITRIVPGRFKGAAFRRGQVIRSSDIPKLLDLGKKQIYVFTPQAGRLHEDEAARRIAKAVIGKNIALQGPKEGRVNFIARARGLLKVNAALLQKINALGSLIISTRHTKSPVSLGEVVAGTRAIPLTLAESKVKRVEEICRRRGPLLQVLPFRLKKVGVLVTGSEIYEKRIQDHSAAVVARKVKDFGSRVTKVVTVPDDPLRIAAEIQRMKSGDCHLIVATGGLSVDPDDVTLAGIRRSGAKVIFYGVPILPGSMSAYARLGKTIILGAPACMIHDPTTALDLFLARTLADDPILRTEISRLGHGGFCLRCRVCRYPVCPFGKKG